MASRGSSGASAHCFDGTTNQCWTRGPAAVRAPGSSLRGFSAAIWRRVHGRDETRSRLDQRKAVKTVPVLAQVTRPPYCSEAIQPHAADRHRERPKLAGPLRRRHGGLLDSAQPHAEHVDEADAQDTVNFSDEVQQEDIVICEHVHGGFQSASYDRGRFVAGTGRFGSRCVKRLTSCPRIKPGDSPELWSGLLHREARALSLPRQPPGASGG